MKNLNMPMPEEAMPESMPAMPAAPMPQGGGGGEVMMNIPKSTFDQLHGIVVQLAEAIDALAMQVEQQAGAEGGEMMPPAESPGAMEDADLAAFAQELSRGNV